MYAFEIPRTLEYSTQNKRLHKLMNKIIGLNEDIPLGGIYSDIEHLKTAFNIIIYIAGMDGISLEEENAIIKKVKSIARNRLNKICASDIKALEEFCNYHIKQVNKKNILPKDILLLLPLLAKQFLCHLNRLNISGNRILVLIYFSIMISYSDGVFSKEEQYATILISKKLNVKRSDVNKLFLLAKINTAIRGIKLLDDTDFDASYELERFYQKIFGKRP